MKYKYTFIFHNKDIKTPLIWALFDEIERDYGYYLYFLKYKEDFDYYSGFSGKESNYKTLSFELWQNIVFKVQQLIDKHNIQAYDNEIDKYIEMTDVKKLYKLYKI
jgi:hypothetical protein|tara:strand:- start:4 stop:321 length:318 start_codon:yes stop_codon:yes gene_type:complete